MAGEAHAVPLITLAYELGMQTSVLRCAPQRGMERYNCSFSFVCSKVEFFTAFCLGGKRISQFWLASVCETSSSYRHSTE